MTTSRGYDGSLLDIYRREGTPGEKKGGESGHVGFARLLDLASVCSSSRVGRRLITSSLLLDTD